MPDAIFFYRRLPFVLVVVCLFVTGCSNSVAVTGRVTYSDNGEPVRSGVVIFTGEKEIARGAIKGGKYSIGRFKDGDGLFPGKYSVSANSFEIPDWALEKDTIQPEEIYYTKEPQTIEVMKSTTYDFQVERGKRP